MELPYKDKIIELFNTGKLTVDSAEWYLNHGYVLVCNDGKVTDIVKEEVM